MLSSIIANDKFTVSYIQQGTNIYFKAKEIALMLGYVNTSNSIKKHVDDEFKVKLSDIYKGGPQNGVMELTACDNSIYLSEPGLYQLAFKSQMATAKEFSKWIAKDVLPSIRISGSYAQPTADNQFILKNERDLHFKVVDFIKKYFPEAILIPGLGELQKTMSMRSESYRKGYKGGQPDILILNLHKIYNGMAIELKTPTGLGVLSPKQSSYLDALKQNNYYTLVSYDYDEIILEITKYLLDMVLLCIHCKKRFKTQLTLDTHSRKTHQIFKSI